MIKQIGIELFVQPSINYKNVSVISQYLLIYAQLNPTYNIAEKISK